MDVAAVKHIATANPSGTQNQKPSNIYKTLPITFNMKDFSFAPMPHLTNHPITLFEGFAAIC